ncbi:MAG: type II secretion system protein N [Sphingosinicella sp.]|uniref:type II secretion system protein N n=1 Tax=Sphingosinicella sp. TaxID=1917971 RepID=UPI004037EB6D
MRAERLFRRLPRPTIFSALELALLALIAVQAARLVWAVVTPLGPLGEWRPASTLNALPAAGGALGDFDPFFRLSGGGAPAVVTALNLQLFGVREDRATGRGSAIIGLPDGTQRSFAVGEEVMPGVTLAAVGFDYVTINRAGAMEQIFLDQSQPAATAGAPQPGQAPPPAPAAPAPPPPIAAAPAPNAPLSLQPRMSNNQITGLIVAPGGDGGAAYRAAGFQPGDVIVAVTGQRVTGADQALTLFRQSGGSVTLMVDRGGRAVPVRMRTNP